MWGQLSLEAGLVGYHMTRPEARIDVVGGFKEMESVLHNREGLEWRSGGRRSWRGEVSVLNEFLSHAKKVETRGRSQQKCAHQRFVGLLGFRWGWET